MSDQGDPTAPPLGRNPAFRRFWVGETTSRVGTAVSSVALPLLAVGVLDASALLVGVLATTVWLPWLVVGLPAGALVDRMQPRTTMLACDLASTLLLASVPVAYWAGVLTIWQLLVVGMGIGVAGVFFRSAYQLMLPGLVREDDLAGANARIQGSEAAARVAGPGLGGLLVQLVGAVWGVVVDAASFAVSFGCLLGLPPAPRPEGTAARRTLAREIGAGLRYVATDPYLRTIGLYAAACNFAVGALQAVQIVFLVRTVGLDPRTIGLLLGLSAVGGILGAVVVSPVIRRLGNARALVLAGLCTFPFVLLLPLTTAGAGLVLFFVGSLVPELGFIVSDVVIDSFRQAYCDRRLLGRVVASTRTVTYGSGALGALAGGAIAQWADPRTGMWVACLALTASVAFVVISPVRGRRRLPTRAAVPAS